LSAFAPIFILPLLLAGITQDNEHNPSTMKELVLTQGKRTMIEDADHERVSLHHWSVQHVVKHWYAFATIESERVYLHRFLLDCPDAQRVKHIDGDTLNNQRANLRAEANDYLGVSYVKNGKRHWKATVRFDGKQRHLGVFDSPEEAALVRDNAARELWGVHAKLNFPVGADLPQAEPGSKDAVDVVL
jgi:hypothetical protein